MEALPQIRQTLSEIDSRTPDTLRFHFLRAHGGALSFGAPVLQPRPRALEDGDPMDCDEAPWALRMDIGTCYLPDHDEDAYFAHAGAGVIFVADGVGGCRETGVDAAAFSRGLVTNARAEVAAATPGTHVCPYTLLERAYHKTVASGTPASSTAVILSLAGGALKWAYVGDSAFAVFRDGKLLHRSQPQQHYFNCPFQLNAAAGSSRVADAAVGEIPVKEGDVVVVGTDGMFDNVFDLELEWIVQMGTTLGFSPKNMADIIAGFAYEASRCPRDSPYSVESRKQKGTPFSCGKPDDITVIVAFIVS